MCGIAGVVYKNGNSSEMDRFETSVKLMSHRGPDHFGVERRNNVGLFHYRLSIIDLSEHAHQPFVDSQSNDCMVYNGEIYNYRDIKRDFNIHTETSSDTEVLFKLIGQKKWSELNQLNGIFAFSYLNNKEKSLTIVRDRLGVKPLYYYDGPDFFAFASEAKVLMSYLDELTIDWKALHEFLWFGSSISNQTMINGIKKLDPGSRLTIDLENFSIEKESFWNMKDDIQSKELITDSYDDAKKKTRQLLEKAVERQCISDVQVGAYLSGGIDSSAVVALASKYTGGKLNTYSVSFDKNPNSELPLARKIAKKYGTNHHEFEVTTKHLEEDIQKLVFQYDEPFADAAAIPLHLMAQQNKNSTRVVLQGDGGDEVFAGYGRHLDMSELTKRKIASKVLSTIHPNSGRRDAMKNRSHVLNAGSSWLRMVRLVANRMSHEPVSIFSDKYKSLINNSDPFLTYKEVDQSIKTNDPVQRMLYTDMQVILPHTYLEKVDKINMYHSIEARVPLLDNDLIDYVMRLPGNYKLRKGITKSFFREIVSDLLPNDILYGRKNSFGTPMNEWLRTTLFNYVKELLQDAEKKYSNLFDVKYLIQLLENHKQRKFHNGALLWRVTVLITWLNIYNDKINLNK